MHEAVHNYERLFDDPNSRTGPTPAGAPRPRGAPDSGPAAANLRSWRDDIPHPLPRPAALPRPDARPRSPWLRGTDPEPGASAARGPRRPRRYRAGPPPARPAPPGPSRTPPAGGERWYNSGWLMVGR